MRDFDEVYALIENVAGWLDEQEAAMLIHFAERSLAQHPDHALVEIGSYYGRSTIALAAVAQAYSTVVYAIDPHRGDVGYPAGYVEPTWDAFNYNLMIAEVTDAVRAYRMPSLAVQLERPIGLLYIDGWHAYEACKGDFEHFAPCYEPDTVVLFHDYGHPEPTWGVKRFVDELLTAGQWRQVGLAGTLIALSRTALIYEDAAGTE